VAWVGRERASEAPNRNIEKLFLITEVLLLSE
jgi:hypothetical protein